MRATWKFVILTLALIASATVTLIWRNQSVVNRTQHEGALTSLESQAHLVSSLVQGKTDFLMAQMTQFVYVRSASRALSGNAQQILSHFEAIALLTVSGHKSWSAKWVEKSVQSPHNRLPEAYLAGLFATLPISSMDPSAPSWVLVEDVNRKPVLALLSFVQLTTSETAPAIPALMVGLVSPAFLADAVKEFAGSRFVATVVDHQGGALAHSDSQWVGQSLTTHPLFRAVASEPNSSVLTTVRDQQKSWLLAGAPVGATNAVAILALPQTSNALAAVQLVILGLGVLVIAGFASFWLARRLEDDLESTVASQLSVVPVASLPEPVKSVSELDLFRRFSVMLSQELKAPAVALLGHVQIALTKTPGADLKNQMKHVEKEARKVKKIVDQLARYSGFEASQAKGVSLPETLERVLARFSAELVGVKVEKHIDSVPQIQAHERQIEIVCEELLRNALQAMSRVAERRLTIAVEPQGSGVRLKIADNGAGISEQIRNKIFEPFYSSEQEERLGLGLATVKSLLLDQGAHLSVNSSGVAGTEMIVDFLPDSAIPKLAKARDLGRIETALAKPKSLPKPQKPPARLEASVRVESAVRAESPMRAEPAVREPSVRAEREEMIPLTDEKLLFAAEPERASSLKRPSAEGLQDFRVKIRRPKLKGDH